jgi:hypothetical protein
MDGSVNKDQIERISKDIITDKKFINEELLAHIKMNQLSFSIRDLSP